MTNLGNRNFGVRNLANETDKYGTVMVIVSAVLASAIAVGAAVLYVAVRDGILQW